MGGQHAGPEIEGVDVLPVVDCFVGVVGVVFEGGAQVDGELADEGEAGGVGYGGVDKTPELDGGVFHQVYAGDVVDGCGAGAFD